MVDFIVLYFVNGKINNNKLLPKTTSTKTYNAKKKLLLIHNIIIKPQLSAVNRMLTGDTYSLSGGLLFEMRIVLVYKGTRIIYTPDSPCSCANSIFLIDIF
jgi:hypothetical protein